MNKKHSHRTCEVCIDSRQGAVTAHQFGADRVELCGNLVEGGTTPTAGMIESVAAATPLPVMVMLRPRGGDFCFDRDEVGVMLAELDFVKRQDIAGIVIGALSPDGNLDLPTCRALCRHADGLEITFHRAFDQTVDPFATLEQLIELGVDRILTSGQAPSAEQGVLLLKKLVEQADGRISIMPGAGISADNVGSIMTRTGCREVHFSGSQLVQSPVTFRRDSVPMSAERTPGDAFRRITSEKKVKSIVRAVDACLSQN
ncbi:MAG: copper homeostasis protein CutC [Pirellulaceae bacterium]|nr:copper homeostasis protein CutC [Pirellulaceae bacterium]